MKKPLPLAAVVTQKFIENEGMSLMRATVNAGKVCTTIVALAIAARDVGHWPTQAEYADYWKQSLRSAQREWALFHRAFPEEKSPDRIAQRLFAEMSARLDDPKTPLAMPAELAAA